MGLTWPPLSSTLSFDGFNLKTSVQSIHPTAPSILLRAEIQGAQLCKTCVTLVTKSEALSVTDTVQRPSMSTGCRIGSCIAWL